MYPLANEIQRYVLKSLYELGVDRKYSMHPGILLDCMFAACEKQGISMMFWKERQKVLFYRSGKRKAERTHQQLLNGQGKHPWSSLASAAESLESILDELYPGVDEHQAKFIRKIPEETMTNEEYLTIVDKTERYFYSQFYQEYLARYQEHALLPVSGEAPIIPQNPKLFEDIITRKHSELMDEYKRVQRLIRKCDDKSLESAAVKLRQQIWAHYLVELAEMKGYPFASKEVVTSENKYNFVLKQDKAALMQGCEIFGPLH